MKRPVVALAMPMRCSGGTDPEALARGVAAKATTSGAIDVSPGQAWTSLLPYTFNLLWTGFLNLRASQKLTHFAMIHDDIRPQGGWLDVMLAEMERVGADLISAVVPIKDGRGLTSTAVADNGDEWGPRRLTMHEVFELPETFTADDLGAPLLLNTGLWVCRFDRPWCERVWFEQRDRVVRREDGTFVPQTFSEDWGFSRTLNRAGVRVAATRKVRLTHEHNEYHNHSPWGYWTTDSEAARPHGPVGPPGGIREAETAGAV